MTLSGREVLGSDLACQGFEAPMDNGAVTVRKNRVLPLKARIVGATGTPVGDTDLVALR
jgi:hypothetical protein